MRSLIVLAALAMIPQIAAAGLFDILDELYISDISELPYSPGDPSISWQESGNIRGYVDIVGFRNLSRDGEKYFILGDPASLAIVAGDATGEPPEDSLIGALISFDKSISISKSDSQIRATLTATMTYFLLCQDEYGKFNCGRRTETATFQDSEVFPEQSGAVNNTRVTITEYNNTIEPKILIQISNINSSRISLNYGNKSLTHSSKSYHVEQTEKGIYYANASDLEAWDIQGQGIARFSDSIIINTNLSSVDYSKLNITVSNLYESVKVDHSQFNISRVTYQPETVLYNPILYGFLGVFFTITGSAFYLIRQVIL